VELSPSVRSIRTALEDVPEAIQPEPLPEDSAAGFAKGTPIQFLNPDKVAPTLGCLTIGSRDGVGREDVRVADEATVIFEVLPSLADDEIRNVLGNGPGELMRLVQVRVSTP
jgi:hypothetical protein